MNACGETWIPCRCGDAEIYGDICFECRVALSQGKLGGQGCDHDDLQNKKEDHARMRAVRELGATTWW
jgi:hypothetical protein